MASGLFFVLTLEPRFPSNQEGTSLEVRDSFGCLEGQHGAWKTLDYNCVQHVADYNLGVHRGESAGFTRLSEDP